MILNIESFELSLHIQLFKPFETGNTNPNNPDEGGVPLANNNKKNLGEMHLNGNIKPECRDDADEVKGAMLFAALQNEAPEHQKSDENYEPPQE